MGDPYHFPTDPDDHLYIHLLKGLARTRISVILLCWEALIWTSHEPFLNGFGGNMGKPNGKLGVLPGFFILFCCSLREGSGYLLMVAVLVPCKKKRITKKITRQEESPEKNKKEQEKK